MSIHALSNFLYLCCCRCRCRRRRYLRHHHKKNIAMHYYRFIVCNDKDLFYHYYSKKFSRTIKRWQCWNRILWLLATVICYRLGIFVMLYQTCTCYSLLRCVTSFGRRREIELRVCFIVGYNRSLLVGVCSFNVIIIVIQN